MPIGSVGPKTSSDAIKTDSSDTTPTNNPTDAHDAVEAQRKAWSERVGEPASTVGEKIDRAVEKGKPKLVAMARDQLSREHTADKDVTVTSEDGVYVALGASIGEQIALKGTKSYDQLVAGDQVRELAIKNKPDTVWARTFVDGHGNASFASGPLSFGFSGGVRLTSIQAHSNADYDDKSLAQRAVQLGKDTANQIRKTNVKIPSSAADLKKINPSIGAEWKFEGNANVTVGLGWGSSDVIGGTKAGTTISAGAGLSATQGKYYEKTLKRIGDPKGTGQDLYYVEIRERDPSTLGAWAGINAVTNIDLVSGLGGTVVDKVADKIEERAGFAANVGASWVRTPEIRAQGYFDINAKAGANGKTGEAMLNEFLKLSPEEAAKYTVDHALGPSATTKTKVGTVAANLQVGTYNLLSFSSMSGTKEGTIIQPPSMSTLEGDEAVVVTTSTLLKENNASRNVEGILPKLLLGEERTVAIRGTNVRVGNKETNAVVIDMHVRDPAVSGEEAAQMQRFATMMGQPLAGFPSGVAHADLGKGGYSLSVALTDAHVANARKITRDQLFSQFGAALKDIENGQSVPPFAQLENGKLNEDGVKQMERYVRDSVLYVGKNRDRVKNQKLHDEYKQRFNRDLDKDIESFKAITELSERLDKARNKPLGEKEWGKFLNTIGKLSSRDLRAAVVTLRRLTAGGEAGNGALITAMSHTIGGTSVSGTAEGVAPKGFDQELADRMIDPRLLPK